MPSLEVAPALSTPDTHVFQDTTTELDAQSCPRLSDEQLLITYEIQRTIDEIRAGKWKRIALQFPDHMLPDAPRIFTALSRRLKQARKTPRTTPQDAPMYKIYANEVDEVSQKMNDTHVNNERKPEPEELLFILADTSYGACCVDEIAAEHAEADVVVHYGRSCLSPTARLPVIYVFTKPPLNVPAVIQTIKRTYMDHNEKIILMADIPYAAYVPEIAAQLRDEGYRGLFETQIVHDTGSPLPNRTVPQDVSQDAGKLRDYHLFHISDPPASLLLMLASRVNFIKVYPATSDTASTTSATFTSSVAMLRRRYALLTSITTVPIFGILINTLSVKNYMHILSHIKEVITAAGKKSYVFVVGKVNAAKVANFAEIGAWVVIGCWESSLFDSKDFWKPVITPFELELALQGDEERVWTGQWTSDFEVVLREAKERKSMGTNVSVDRENVVDSSTLDEQAQDPSADAFDSEEESEPPEFDLHTGRYISHTRPMNPSARSQRPPKPGNGTGAQTSAASQSLIKRANGDLAVVGNEVSPAAEFFREKRSWRGLGSDYEIAYDNDSGAETRDERPGAAMEQGRVGIARGYVVGDDETRR